MKRESLGWFVAGAVIVLTCTLGAMQQQGSVGRFQLVEGMYDIVGEKVKVTSHTVWRIDTVTGETEHYVASLQNGKYEQGWSTVQGKYAHPR